VTVGAAFLAGAAVAGLSSPLVGRLSDRRGWRLPVLAGLCLSTVWVVLLWLPRTVAPLFALVVVADGLFGVSYPPAGAMISGGAESLGLDQAYGFGLFNMAWAGGQVIGGAGSAGLAQATADALPYSLLAALCLITLLVVARQGRRVKAVSS
jgi:MFS family permease